MLDRARIGDLHVWNQQTCRRTPPPESWKKGLFALHLSPASAHMDRTVSFTGSPRLAYLYENRRSPVALCGSMDWSIPCQHGSVNKAGVSSAGSSTWVMPVFLLLLLRLLLLGFKNEKPQYTGFKLFHYRIARIGWNMWVFGFRW